jgi:glycogen operon protein
MKCTSPASRGTYAGLIEKVLHLADIVVTAVELLPVFQVDAQDAPLSRVNSWGYFPMPFFAPYQGYSARQDPLGPLDKFRERVKALHCAGIEVILAVVYNHTAEGNHAGPTLCYRGLENGVYDIRALHDTMSRRRTRCQAVGLSPEDHMP